MIFTKSPLALGWTNIVYLTNSVIVHKKRRESAPLYNSILLIIDKSEYFANQSSLFLILTMKKNRECVNKFSFTL